jgi:serine/threonine protein kinase
MKKIPQTDSVARRDRADMIGTLEGFVEMRALGSHVSLWRNASQKREIAVKEFLRIDKADEAFKREANVLYRLDHPMILRLEFVCMPEGEVGPQIATQYLGDDSLARVLRDRPGWWTPTMKATTIAGLVSGMIYIHECDVIHRDLKPSNILFDDHHQVRIADFGSSRYYEVDITLTRAVGTPLYMARELYAPVPKYTKSVDVYAFGLVLYEVVVGHGVLSTPDRIQAARQLIEAGGRPEIPSSVSGGVRDLICRCWSDNAESRPSFGEILDSLLELDFAIVRGVNSEEVSEFLWSLESQIERCK